MIASHEYFTVRQAGIGMPELGAGIRMILMAGTSLEPEQ